MAKKKQLISKTKPPSVARESFHQHTETGELKDYVKGKKPSEIWKRVIKKASSYAKS
jgi:hypothetical protein